MEAAIGRKESLTDRETTDIENNVAEAFLCGLCREIQDMFKSEDHPILNDKNRTATSQLAMPESDNQSRRNNSRDRHRN